VRWALIVGIGLLTVVAGGSGLVFVGDADAERFAGSPPAGRSAAYVVWSD
jgi:hypothetical protein